MRMRQYLVRTILAGGLIMTVAFPAPAQERLVGLEVPAGVTVPIPYLAGLYNAGWVTKAPRLQPFHPTGCLVEGGLIFTGNGKCTLAGMQNLPWIAIPVQVEKTPPNE